MCLFEDPYPLNRGERIRLLLAESCVPGSRSTLRRALMALLEVQNLTVDFDLGVGSLRAVDDVSFAIDAGEALGLVGESGSGKTVTALSIMRLLDQSAKITQGHIWFDGQDLAAESDVGMQSIRGRGIGMVFQEPMTSLNPGFTVGEQRP